MITHELAQGSDDWIAFRFEHDGASEAVAMLGLSKKTPRNELLHVKHTRLPKEFSDFVQKNILDNGHVVEALARPIVEEIIGEDLYPVTCSDGRLSASCDGLTLDERIAFEHKQWNIDLAAAVAGAELPEEYMPQCQQVLMVTGAEKLIFVVSDGTRENLEYIWIYPDQAWFKRIRAGWKQFHADLAAYTPVEVVAPVVASPTLNLPAVSVQVQGSIALLSNLPAFGAALNAFISKIPEKPSTDQEFADCKSAIGKLQDAQDALDAAEANALGQIATFDEMRRTKALYFDLARTTRLALEKLVTRRESEIKLEIVQGGKDAFLAHVVALNTRLERQYMPPIFADWAAAIKSKRNIASLQNAVDTLLSQKKIEASQIADNIEANLKTLRALGAGHEFLFSDEPAIIWKANDDLVALIKSRIADHTAAEAKKAEELRAKIQAEEQAKAEAKIRSEQAAAQKLIDDEATRARQQADIVQRAAEKPSVSIPAVVLSDKSIADAKARSFIDSIDTGAKIKLGEICLRLGFTVTADFLVARGFPQVGRECASKLYRACDFPAICQAIVNHVQAVASEGLQQAA
jgi:predicted phage-related endonuclease